MGDKDGETPEEARVWLHKRDANKAAATAAAAADNSHTLRGSAVRAIRRDNTSTARHCPVSSFESTSEQKFYTWGVRFRARARVFWILNVAPTV